MKNIKFNISSLVIWTRFLWLIPYKKETKTCIDSITIDGVDKTAEDGIRSIDEALADWSSINQSVNRELSQAKDICNKLSNHIAIKSCDPILPSFRSLVAELFVAQTIREFEKGTKIGENLKTFMSLNRIDTNKNLDISVYEDIWAITKKKLHVFHRNVYCFKMIMDDKMFTITFK